MGSIWLDMGSYLVRMMRTGARKLSKCLPDLWDPIKIKRKNEKSWKSRRVETLAKKLRNGPSETLIS